MGWDVNYIVELYIQLSNCYAAVADVYAPALLEHRDCNSTQLATGRAMGRGNILDESSIRTNDVYYLVQDDCNDCSVCSI